jgi:hypothetical protein
MVTLYVVTSYEHFCGALAVFANSPQNAAKRRKMPQNAANITNWQ